MAAEQKVQKIAVNAFIHGGALSDLSELNSNIKIKFVRDEETGRELVKMVDKSSDTVIRQIPSELAIKLSTEIEEMFKIKEGDILSEQV